MRDITAGERALYLMACFMARLPARVQVWLSREPPLVIDGLQYDPAAQLLRAFRRRRIRFGLVEPSVAIGRKRFRRETQVFRGPVTEVGGVRDFEIRGPAGPLRVRHYAPLTSERAPLTVFLHGGGFVIGDLDSHDEPCRMLCRYAGVHVLSIDYRLAPEHPLPAAVDDALAALAWAQTHAESLGADPRRVAIGGDSAGGNLAAVTSRLAAGHARPFAQLLIYPPTDGVTKRPSHGLFGEGFTLTLRDGQAFSKFYAGGTGVARDDPRLSPLYATDLARLPPALVVTAGFDLLRDEGEAYAAALAKAGVKVRTRRVDSLGHGFIHMTGVAPAARQAMMALARDWRSLLDDCA
jgi:acetyl esterase